MNLEYRLKLPLNYKVTDKIYKKLKKYKIEYVISFDEEYFYIKEVRK